MKWPRASRGCWEATLAILLAVGLGGAGCSKPSAERQRADRDASEAPSAHPLQVRLDVEHRGSALYAHLQFKNLMEVPISVPAYVFAVHGTSYFQICPGATGPCGERDALKYNGPHAKWNASILRTLASGETVEKTLRIDGTYDLSQAPGEFRARYRWGCMITIGATEESVELRSNQVIFQR